MTLSRSTVVGLLWFVVLSRALAAQPRGTESVPPVPAVSLERFIRSESERHFQEVVHQGGFGTFVFSRDPVSLDRKAGVRPSRDTLDGKAVWDLDAGPVTITLPEMGERFVGLQLITQDHCSLPVDQTLRKHVITRERCGTRYVMTVLRMFVSADPDEVDVRRVRSLQNQVTSLQPGGSGTFEVPRVEFPRRGPDPDQLRSALQVVGEWIPDRRRMFGVPSEVDPVRHLVGSAKHWGGLPQQECYQIDYPPLTGDKEKGWSVTVKDVPVDAFWSMTVYNHEGVFVPSADLPVSVNSVTAQKDADGAVTVNFGGTDKKARNYLPVVSHIWSYTVRLYRPRAKALSGDWQFPAVTARK